MKRLLGLVAVMVVALAGCGSSSESTDTVTINMGLMKDIAHIPYIYAEETGMYDEAGLDVNLTFFNAAKDRNAGWETGDYQVQTADLADVEIMAGQGQDIVATGSVGSDFKLVASPELSSSYDGDIASLDGKSVGYSENTVTEYYIDYVADEYGISFDKVPFPAIPDRFAALQSGELDLAILPDPFPSQAMADGAKLVWDSIAEQAPQLSNLTWQGSFYNENTEAVEKFIEVSNEAVAAVNGMEPSEYKDMVMGYDLIDEAYYDEVTDGVVYSKLEKSSEETWNLVNEWGVDKGIIADPKEYSDIVVA